MKVGSVHRTRRVLLLGGTALLAAQVLAQVPVVESQGSAAARYGEPAAAQASTPGASATASTPSPAGEGQRELFLQLQALQIEMQELRGLVEEQRHQLNRLAREQKEQYLDIDRRLAGGAGQGSANPSASGSTAAGAGSPGASAGTTGARASTGGSERGAYTRAFDLTREKRFAEAIDGFNQLIADYPNGPYTPNSLYWLGELYLALPEPDLEQSRQSFVQVVDQYATHQKVPDALYKLGVVYDRLGNQDEALRYFQRVETDYSSSPAARLARAHAAELR
jgi:tol-pal system protein YbgF